MKIFFAAFTIIGFILLSLFSCEDAEPYFPNGGLITDTIELPKVYTSVSDVLQEFSSYSPIQQKGFLNSEGVTIRGNDGVTITLQPNSTTDVASGDSLYIVLREYLTPNKMFYGKVQTESNQRILVTGGSFWWDLKDTQGNSVTIDPSLAHSRINVQTDITGYQGAMEYFIGEQTNGGGQEIVNWFQGGGEAGFIEGGFEIFETELGWANCDALLDIPADQYTQFKVGFSASEGIEIADKSVFMFIQDFPSLINIYTPDGEYLKTYDNSVPLGLNATLVGVAVDENGYLLIGSLPIQVMGDDIFTIEMSYGTTEELQQLVENITQ